MQTHAERQPAAMSRTRYAEMVRQAERVFSVMREFIDAPDSRLKAYRDDFYSLDRNYLREKLAAGQFLWVVRETGTDLRTLGMGELEHDWLRANMNVSSARDIYLVDARAGTVTPLNDEKAYALLDDLRYRVDANGVVMKDGRPLATVSVSMTWSPAQERNCVDVSFESVGVCDETDHVALATIAASMAGKTGQSLFANLREVTLDGTDLYAMLAPALPALDAGVTWYGTVEVAREEHGFIRSLGVETGSYDERSKVYPVKVSDADVQKLAMYAESMPVRVHALPHAFKVEGEVDLSRSLARLSDDHLCAYGEFLRFEASLQRPVVAAQEALDGEQKRRAARPSNHADRRQTASAVYIDPGV